MHRSSESNHSAENPKSVEHAWFFDIDGVLTDTKEILVNPDLIEKIASFLKKGEPVAFISGRSLTWVKNRVLEVLDRQNIDVAGFENLMIAAEKGAALAHYREGELVIALDRNISVPGEIAKKAKELVQKPQFSSDLFFDDTKETMVTVEMHPETEQGQSRQRALNLIAEKFRVLIRNSGFDESLRVIRSSIAVDIESLKVGKKVATQKVIDWLANRQIKPRQVKAFGDSVDDQEIADASASAGYETEFVFVGPSHRITMDQDQYSVVIPNQPNDLGTLEYLSSHT